MIYLKQIDHGSFHSKCKMDAPCLAFSCQKLCLIDKQGFVIDMLLNQQWLIEQLTLSAAPSTLKCTRRLRNTEVHLGSVLLEGETEPHDMAETNIRQWFWSLTHVRSPWRTFETTVPPPGFLIPQAWSRAWQFAFFTSFQEILVLLVQNCVWSSTGVTYYISECPELVWVWEGWGC